MDRDYSIEAENLTKRFGNFTAVDAVHFSVQKGEIFGFLGANGAGKTTCIRMLTGLLKPSEGRARVAGYDLSRRPNAVKRNIGYMSQRFSLYEDLSVRENIRLFGRVYGLKRSALRKRSDELLDQLSLEPLADELVRDLPLGWRQRLSFSIALLHRPDIVFLDEPTGGVDPITRRQFWEQIYAAAEAGITVFVTTHHMEEAEYCDRIGIMARGRLEALDTPAALKSKYQADSLDEVFIALYALHQNA